MSSINVNNVSIVDSNSSDQISNGITTVTIYYDCEIDDLNQNPVRATLFVNSALNVTFDESSWNKTMFLGKNRYTKLVNVIVNNVISGTPISISLQGEDRFSNTSAAFTSIIVI